MSDYNITDLLSPAFLERMQNMLGNEYEDCTVSGHANPVDPERIFLS